jgi:predicted MFS family arabinose efflux permease
LAGSTLTDRAPIFTAIYLLCYSGAAVPALISGHLSDRFSLPQIALAYGALALVATVVTVLGARNPRADSAEDSALFGLASRSRPMARKR